MALIRVLAVIGYCLVAVSGGVEIETLTPKAAADKIEDAVTTKLTPSLTADAKSKTEKRDSADQTGAIFPGRPTKETPFRPIYPSASYYEAPTQIFGPTTVRYTAAEAAPQTYYDKPESGNGIRYAPSGAGHKPSVQFAQQAHRFSFAAPPQVELYQRPAATKSASLGAEQQQQQQQQKQQQQQREIFNYGEVEAEGGAIYERAGPQQYQLTLPVHHQHKFQQPQQQQQQPRVQYIIAIPLSYMRQLQQQQQQQQNQQQQHQLLVAPPTPSASPSSSTTSSSAAPPSTAAPGPRHHQSFMQLLGPLARDHQGLYRPYYQSDAASAPLTGIGTPAGPNPSPPSHQQQQYFQIPASLLLAAAQQLQQQHQQQSQQQAVYAKAAPPPPPPPPSYQQLIYQAQPQAQAPQHHPQLQLQRIFLQPPQAQTSAIYAEQPGGTLYAYPRLKQQQQQKYTPATDSVAARPTAATAAAAGAAGDVAATTAEAATATRPTAQHLPIVHYNPIYVQAPAEQQQQQQQPQHHQLQLQQHQFAILPRFSNNNPKAAYNLGHESTPPIHVVRLSAAGAPGHGHGHGHGPVPFHHFHHYQPGSVPLLQQLYHAPQQQHQQQQYVSHMPYGHEEVPLPGPVSLPSTVPGMTGASPAIIPYFSHPGAVHYGTHLYHPAAAGAATAATKGGAAAATGAGTAGAGAGAGVGVGSAATSPKQQSTSGGHSPGGGNNIVKYP
ncbi:mediator of RNA polymerase II transcription subunit 15 [Drosophila subobscura]|uniref:mediator of RNA polymerase II transcription subunit 15 n=1 Tax=Drosophila subobscura TaxID=7241 RepID=UPI00155A3C5D|nr:mediator of RNA polymerase II transcription subunit 15 [Drosophila subobscura]